MTPFDVIWTGLEQAFVAIAAELTPAFQLTAVALVLLSLWLLSQYLEDEDFGGPGLLP